MSNIILFGNKQIIPDAFAPFNFFHYFLDSHPAFAYNIKAQL